MIQTGGLNKRFETINAVVEVSLTVQAKEIVVVFGPSGCGKTTLLRLIAGLEWPDSGEIRIGGQCVSSKRKLTKPNKRRLSMIFQDLALWPHMQVWENVKFGLNGSDIKVVQDRVASVLQWVSLEKHAKRYPHQLSGGEKQRLAIARALAPGHPYLLMDEPFSSLDPVLKEDMIRLVKQLQESLHTAILYVTHNLDEALALANRILMMVHGRIVGELDQDDLDKLSQQDLLQWYKKKLSA